MTRGQYQCTDLIEKRLIQYEYLFQTDIYITKRDFCQLFMGDQVPSFLGVFEITSVSECKRGHLLGFTRLVAKALGTVQYLEQFVVVPNRFMSCEAYLLYNSLLNYLQDHKRHSANIQK